MKGKLILLMCLLIVGLIVLIILIKENIFRDDGTFNIEYVGEIDIENNLLEEQYFYNRSTPDIIYLKESHKDEKEYILESNTFAQHVQEIECQYNIKIEYETNKGQYLIVSYGSKIAEAYTMCVDDGSEAEFFETSYYGAVIYEKEFNENKLYLYTIDRTDIWFAPIISVLETYGKTDNIKLVQTTEDTVDLHFYIPWGVNPYSNGFERYDPTREIKVYYYKYEEPYLYTINKWNRYMVVNTNTLEIIERTENLNIIPKEHSEVFENIEEFADISDIDTNYIENTFEIGNGTLIFSASTKYISLINEKEREIRYYTSNFVSRIEYCLIKEKYIYVVDENGYYKVIDVENYKVIEKTKDLNVISNEHKAVFGNLDAFLTKEDLMKMVQTVSEENS